MADKNKYLVVLYFFNMATISFFLQEQPTGFCGAIIVMLRLISFGTIVLCLAVFSGCKMCASHTDIVGSPVPNAMASDYHRAGSYYGGYSSGGYVDGYQATASPQRVYDSEFSRQSAGGSVQTSSYGSTGPTITTPNYGY